MPEFGCEWILGPSFVYTFVPDDQNSSCKESICLSIHIFIYKFLIPIFLVSRCSKNPCIYIHMCIYVYICLGSRFFLYFDFSRILYPNFTRMHSSALLGHIRVFPQVQGGVFPNALLLLETPCRGVFPNALRGVSKWTAGGFQMDSSAIFRGGSTTINSYVHMAHICLLCVCACVCMCVQMCCTLQSSLFDLHATFLVATHCNTLETPFRRDHVLPSIYMFICRTSGRERRRISH